MPLCSSIFIRRNYKRKTIVALPKIIIIVFKAKEYGYLSLFRSVFRTHYCRCCPTYTGDNSLELSRIPSEPRHRSRFAESIVYSRSRSCSPENAISTRARGSSLALLFSLSLSWEINNFELEFPGTFIPKPVSLLYSLVACSSIKSGC